MNCDPRSYDEDFFAWTQYQATLLRDGKWDAIDLPNLAEEIDSLGKRDRHGVSNRLQVLGHKRSDCEQGEGRTGS